MSTNIVVPELGESVVEARVAKWLKKPGDHVSAGEALVELETEKIDLEVSADRPGVLAAIKHQEGSDVKVGEILAVLEESTNGASAQAPVPEVPQVSASAAAGRSSATSPKHAESQASDGAPKRSVPSATSAKGTDKKATPTAKNVAKAHDVKLDAIESSGSRVTKQDVLKATSPAPQEAKAPAPAPEAPYAPQAPRKAPAGDRGETRERMTKRR